MYHNSDRFTVNCRLKGNKNSSTYIVEFQYNQQLIDRVKELPVQERKWSSLNKTWEIKVAGLLKIMSYYRKSDKIFFDFGSTDEKKLFIDKIKKIQQKEREDLETLENLKLKNEEALKLKIDLEKNYIKHSDHLHSFLKKGVQLYPHQIVGTIFLNYVKSALISLEMGLGKAQDVDSQLVTPNGFVRMGDVKVGDYIIGSNGKPTKVLGVFPQGKKDIYELKFNDGSTARSCDEHLWNVNTYVGNWRKYPYLTKTLREIMDEGLQFKNGNNRWYIPITKPIEFEQKELKIDPYVMGCLLGDGSLTTTNSIGFTSEDKEIVDEINNRLPKKHLLRRKKDSLIDYGLSSKGQRNNDINTYLLEYKLKETNSHTKFIPHIYKFSSIEQRLDLLRGILDTDGHSRKDTIIELTLASENLIKDVQFIVQSLGGIGRLKDKWITYKGEKKRYYRLLVKLPPEFIPFKLQRKIDTFVAPTKYLSNRAIKEVNYIGKKEAQCILVDAEDHLYLTDNCVVTHNTLISIAYAEMMGFHKVIVITPNSLKFNFYGEVEIFTHSPAHIVNYKNNKYTIEESKYIIVNYDFFRGSDAKKTKAKFDALNIGIIDGLIADECFTYDTLIDTDRGKLQIGEIVEKQLDVKILSYNHKLKKIERKSISRHLYNGYKDVIRVKFSDGNVIECTPEHKFYSITEDKYKPIKDFKNGKKIVKKKNQNSYSELQTVQQEISNKRTYNKKMLFSKLFDEIEVESIEVLESGNRRKFARGGEQNKKVYDLEVVDNHNYFANGVLVSNCHAIKNTNSNTYKNFKRLFKDIQYKVFLSGTPAPNRVHELYTVLNQVSPLEFATKKFFYEYYCGLKYNPNSQFGGGWMREPTMARLEELFYKIAPYTYRKRKEEVLTDLPDKIYQKIMLELNQIQDIQYEEIERGVANEIFSAEKLSGANALTIMLRLRQYTSMIKLDYIKELIDQVLDENEKVIIVDMFKEILGEIHKMYPDISALHTGDQSVEERAELVKEFQNPNGKIKIFLASIQTANYGLTLTAASKMFIITLPFSVGQYDQVSDRCILKGELVLTKNGYIPIENVNCGDLVYTHKGNWKKVFNKKNKIEREKPFYDIKYKGFYKPLRCTDDHKIYVYDEREMTYKWVMAKDLELFNHKMVLTKPNLSNYNSKFEIKKYEPKKTPHNLIRINYDVKLSNDLLYAMGRFVGDGWVNENDVVICGHIKEYEIVKKSLNTIRGVFGVDGYGERIEPDDNRCSCYTYSKELTINFERWFGKRAENKKIPEFIFHLEPEKIKSFLRGYYDADGYKRKNTQQASTVSKYLSYQLILLENMLGNTSTIRYNEFANCWSFEYSLNDKIKRNKLIKNDNGNVLYPIQEIRIYKPKRNDEKVYDLEIEDDSSFVVGLSSVHNCHRIGQKDTVWIYPLIFKGTIDEYVFSVIEDKRAEIMKGIDNIDYESNVSESVIKDVIEKLRKKYGN